MQIFLSFAFEEDRDQVNGFRGMLDNPAAGINFNDGSCKKDYAGRPEKEIKSYIGSLLDQSSVSVCLLSKDSKDSDWIDWELKASESKNKGIIGIILKDQKLSPQDMPAFFRERSRYDVIEWDSPEMMHRAIQRAERSR